MHPELILRSSLRGEMAQRHIPCRRSLDARGFVAQIR